MSSLKTLKIIALAVLTVLIIVFLTILNGPPGYWTPDWQLVKNPDLEPASWQAKGKLDNFRHTKSEGQKEKSDDSTRKQEQDFTSQDGTNQEIFEENSTENANFNQAKFLSQEREVETKQIDSQDAFNQGKSKTQDTNVEQAKSGAKGMNFEQRENDKTKVRFDNSFSQKFASEKMNLNTSTASNLSSLEKDKKYNYENNIEWKTDLDSLVEMLRDKISLSIGKMKEIELQPTCSSPDTIANSCDKGKKCLRMQFPTDLKTRVAQLVNSAKLQLTKDIQKVLQEMSKKVIGTYDVILLTAASSNHFFESQAMIKNVHENVFPVMKNFTFLFYNLGLSPEERRAMVRYCKCQVLDFPFEKFPEFMRNLVCYSWKPVLIKAHLKQANVLIWADASVRFHRNPDHLKEIVDRTRQRSIQIGGSSNKSPFRTFKNMYHYFGDEPCVYLWMGQAKATVGFYGRDPFVDRAVLEPWVACAVHQECMCQPDADLPAPKGCAESKKMTAAWGRRKGKISYGLCHRFDQSAISLILHKLYQGHYKWVMVNVLQFVDFRRRNTIIYFPH